MYLPVRFSTRSMTSLAAKEGRPGVWMLKIERSANGQVVLTLSGRIEEEGMENLKQVLATEAGTQQLALDLRNVTLVNQKAVEFLADCEADGIRLERCPLYIRKWVEQSKRQKSRGS